MKTNVNYQEKRFFVNDEKNQVLCKLTSKLYLPQNSNFLFELGAGENDLVLEYLSAFEYDTEDNSFTFETEGISKCQAPDVFDEELGKKIALTRAQQAAFKFANMIYVDLMKIVSYDFTQFMNTYNMFAKHTEMAVEKCRTHANKLCGIENDDVHDYDAPTVNALNDQLVIKQPELV